jgi:murein L,D-transpeptidase YafK
MKQYMFLALLCLFGSCDIAGDAPESREPLTCISRLEVFKSQRVMHVYCNDVRVRSYSIQLGFSPKGHKQKEGDGKTPEGDYTITDLNPNSQYYKSAGISYPNAEDRKWAREHGFSPGGDIRIHGLPNGYSDDHKILFSHDWTLGCIALCNADMEELYRHLTPGTPITICP